jgi:4-amino-4-deoxy-L-arabinose transferase-like glycosyltransferase
LPCGDGLSNNSDGFHLFELLIMVTSAKSRKPSGVLLILLAGTVVGALIVVPFSWPMGGFWIDAQQFASSGHISSSFTPCGYPGLLGLGVRIGGIQAVIAIQVLLYVGIVAAIYRILRLLALDRTPALIGASVLGFHPELVISIKKVWDTNITTVFLLLLCAILLAVLRRGLTPTRALLAGIVWGLSINVRPNFPVLILPIAFAFWFAPVRGNRIRTLLTNGTLTLAAAVLAVIVVSVVVHGALYIPQNGPYNFYAGDNAFTQRALLDSLNAEPSIYPSLLAEGFSRQVNVYDSGLRPYYVQHALFYIRRNPFQAFKLVLLKLATLLRPDTKIHPLASLGGAVKVLLALAIPLWLIALVASRHNIWELEDWLFLVFVAAYVVPFLLTNSDPRFRVPLDVLVLTHAVYRIARILPFRFPVAVRERGVEDGFARAAR